MPVTKEFTVFMEEAGHSRKSVPRARRPWSEHSRSSVIPDWRNERHANHIGQPGNH